MVILVEDYISRDPGFLYETITESIEKGMRLVINFKGVSALSNQYLLESIGRVIKENEFESIKNKLNFINVDKKIKSQLIVIIKEN